jgi:hypothetical protein
MNGTSVATIGLFNNTCSSVVGNGVETNGGKLSIAGCSAGGIVPPKDFFGRPTLVQ